MKYRGFTKEKGWLLSQLNSLTTSLFNISNVFYLLQKFKKKLHRMNILVHQLFVNESEWNYWSGW